jgi:hypothetical protein
MDTLLTLPDKTLEETVKSSPKLRDMLGANLDRLPPMTRTLLTNVIRSAGP